MRLRDFLHHGVPGAAELKRGLFLSLCAYDLSGNKAPPENTTRAGVTRPGRQKTHSNGSQQDSSVTGSRYPGPPPGSRRKEKISKGRVYSGNMTRVGRQGKKTEEKSQDRTAAEAGHLAHITDGTMGRG